MTLSAASASLVSGMASLVEFIEASTVVLAVGATRGWRSTLAGAALAVILLVLLVAMFGPAVRGIPVAFAQLSLGTLLTLFGIRWLRKATRRAAGLIPLRDEIAAFRRHSDRIGRIGTPAGRWDLSGMAMSFQATALEGLEVVFIVVAVGAGGSGLLGPAIGGAFAALVIVCVLAFLLHGPITRVPENTLKQIVGSTLSGFGTYWIGEGAGLRWPVGDLSMPLLALAFYALSVVTAKRLRGTHRVPSA